MQIKIVSNLASRLHLRQGFGGIIWLMASGLLLFSSCVSNKKFVYLQDKGTVKMDSSGIMPVQAYAYRLQNADVLYISLTSDDDRLNKIFVPGGGGGGQMMMQQGQGVSGGMLYFIGFTIDPNGQIEFPYLGKIGVAGKTIEEAKETVQVELRKFFKVFFLQMKVAEFKFSVLGYVNRPGQYFFQQNKVSIIEAIAQAGELQNLAKRFELQLYRQYPEGVKLHVIDLTDRSIVNSALWYVQPNDVLYVIPLKARTIGDLSSLQSSFGVIAPLLSTMLLVINTYILIKNL
jgi:polysaccharide export outer membrane protein